MLSTPYKGCTSYNISQTYHEGHPALDIVKFEADGGYGTPLTAPEDCEIVKITEGTNTPGDTTELKRGYGIYLKGLETGFTHLYWHIWPVVPVNLRDKVKRGQIVAWMGNAGYVFQAGKYVPLEERTKDNHPGTHLHWELFDTTYKIGGTKPFLNPLKYIDWTFQPNYSKLDYLKAITVTLAKTLKLMKQT